MIPRSHKLCALFAVLLLQSSLAVAERIVIRDVTLISAERHAPLQNAWIAIDGQRIVATGAGVPDLGPGWTGATVISGEGRYVTPGLIDSHVHLAVMPGLPWPLPEELEQLAAHWHEQLPRSYLFFGYTTLIDLNVFDTETIKQFRSRAVAPDVLHCGASLPVANGYPMVFLPPAERYAAFPNFVVDDRATAELPDHVDAGEHTVTAALDRVVVADGICAKAYTETGFGRMRDLPSPDARLLGDMLRASHARGLPLLVHANSFEAHDLASRVGVDMLVHGMWNWGEHSSEPGMASPVQEVLQRISDRRIGYMPTMQVMQGLKLMHVDGFLDNTSIAQVVPEEILAWYRSDAGRFFADEVLADFGGDPARMLQIIERITSRGQLALAELAHNDALLLFGTDTPSAPTYANPPGLNGYLEMQRWVEAGVSLHQLLRAATLDNARAFGIDDDYGTVEPGKVANLLLLSGNPLESVDAWGSIETVVLRGTVHDRADFSARPSRGGQAQSSK